MGLGKTAQAITCCDILRRTGRIRRGLIIAPASLKPQWAREWQMFSDLPVQVVDGSPDERQAAYAKRKEGFLIINYEQLLRDLEIVRRWDPELVVLDEAQRIKNWATKTALSVKGLAPRLSPGLDRHADGKPDRRAGLDRRVGRRHGARAQVAAQLPARDAGRRPPRGRRRPKSRHDPRPAAALHGAPHPPGRARPASVPHRHPRADRDDRRADGSARRTESADRRRWCRSLKRPLTQAEFLKLMQLLTTQRIISNGMAQLNFEGMWPTIRDRAPEENVLKSLFAPKLIELRQLVRQIVLEQGRKVVIFSQWRRMLTLAHWAVSDLLGEDGLRAGFFTGAEGQRRRTQNIVEFHDDPSFRMLFTSDAGGVGLNLQRAANCVVNLELPWNPAVLEQRIGRIYRMGQKLPIDVYNLVCEQGIESRIAALVGSKQAFFKGLFDGDSDTVDFGQASNFLAKVQKLYEPAARRGRRIDGQRGRRGCRPRRHAPRRRGRRPVRRADRGRRRVARPGCARPSHERRLPAAAPVPFEPSGHDRFRRQNRSATAGGRRDALIG